MGTGRLFLKLGVLAALAASGALLLALARAQSFYWRGWGAVNPFEVGKVGYSPVSHPDGTYARFEVFNRTAYTECRWVLRRDAEHPLALQRDASTGAWPGDVPSWAAASGAPGDAAMRRYGRVIDTAFGWPFRCLAARITQEDVPLTDPAVARLSGLKVGDTVSQMKVLDGLPVTTVQHGWREYLYPDTTYWPTRILWSGLLANTALYALVLAAPWIVRAAFVAARAAHRNRRGLCSRCAHSRAGLAGGAPCPECGAPAITAASPPPPRTPTASRR